MADQPSTLRCLRLQIEGFELLMPDSIVAEVIAYQPIIAMPNAAKGHMGMFIWRGVQVPLLSLEILCDMPLPSVHSRARIAVMYHPDGNPEQPYLGLLMQDIPRPQLIEESHLQLMADIGPCEWVSSCVEYQGTELLVPNFDRIFS